MDGFVRKILQLLEIFVKITYVNLLWIGFSILGLVIFGVMPASVALLTVMRRWLMEDTDIPIFKCFSSAFKKEFRRSNIFGVIFLIIFMILYSNFRYVISVDGLLQAVLAVGLIINGSLFLVTFIYFFPVYVHYKLKFHEYFKQSILMGMVNIHLVLLICMLFFIIYHLFIYFPGYLGIFLPSAIGMTLMSITLISFKKFEKKKAKLEK
ncbi:DUF624 domain-containing protein [Bacillaceae bacterium IKA-2]|nr:DUF624 domain-containing protein [Bacillaceae bacterium IKA-2]